MHSIRSANFHYNFFFFQVKCISNDSRHNCSLATNSTTDNVMIHRLSAGMTYSIQLAGRTSEGVGVWSKQFLIGEFLTVIFFLQLSPIKPDQLLDRHTDMHSLFPSHNVSSPITVHIKFIFVQQWRNYNSSSILCSIWLPHLYSIDSNFHHSF